ncbi:23S rRNA (uracil(1939)-C(5))-methyltransferase RlmD [Kiloniella sp. b19]|uniref:23S rRNA (uracil(1939)-C(5))-methyltransferase RlmD n=1 Tax=Kiloniella sp. GXU_MW_B19 TaxID=3141326 RepID=UPI0031DA209E
MRRKARPGGGKQIEYVIESLGARGDGVSSYDGQPLFTAMTLPGERLRGKVKGTRNVGLKADVLELLEESPDRQDPVCEHFGPCGGCTLQHAKPEFYRKWKRDLVVQSLSRKGFEAEELVGALVEIPAQTRRRAVFAAEFRGKRARLGFHGRESHDLVDIRQCHLLAPELMELVAPLRDLLTVLLAPQGQSGAGAKADITVNLSDNGADILLVGKFTLKLEGREAVSAFAQQNRVARISWIDAGNSRDPKARREDPEPLYVGENPVLTFGSVPVTPQPGSFLQPSREGEEALVSLVLDALPEDAETIADLYCGCGTFTFPLSKRGRVHAIEGDPGAVAALSSSARRFSTGFRVTADCRDLAREPVEAEDLEGGDVVVIDPPRAGAKEQCGELAVSDVPVVVYVSCNPNAFARDARILEDGGYRLERVTPVDQFIWSGHVELVARFIRPEAFED